MSIVKDKEPALIGIQDASFILHRSPSRVRQLIDKGHLPAQWTSIGWIFARADVEALREEIDENPPQRGVAWAPRQPI